MNHSIVSNKNSVADKEDKKSQHSILFFKTIFTTSKRFVVIEDVYFRVSISLKNTNNTDIAKDKLT